MMMMLLMIIKEGRESDRTQGKQMMHNISDHHPLTNALSDPKQ